MGVSVHQDRSVVGRGLYQHAVDICDHLVQFYDAEQYLHTVVCNFFDPLWRDGGTPMSGMILGRPAIIKVLEERLAVNKYTCVGVVDRDGARWKESDFESRTAMGRFYRRGKQNILLTYADPLLAVYLPEGKLLSREFGQAVHKLLAQLQPEEASLDAGQALDLSQLPFYVFGDLVDIVCSRGQHLIALELETLWNGIMASYNMSLLCGYSMESFQNSLVENVFAQICHHHSTVGPTEAYSKLGTMSQKLEMVAVLQQKVTAFHATQESHWSNGDVKERIKHRGQFLDVLCHELRNPVSGIIGNVELLQEGLDIRQGMLNNNAAITSEDIALLQKQLSDDYASVDAIAICAEHMKSVSDDILNLSKLEEGKAVLVHVLFDIKAIITSVIKMYLTAARKKGIHLLAEFPPEALRVLGDRGRAAQVLINLVSNAIKFTSSGSITVSLSCMGPVVAGGRSSIYKIAVRDTGCGLTKDEISELFQRFVQPVSTVVAEHGGSGLGLYISKNLAELMGGLLYVESRKGEGSMFVFTFQAEPCVVTAWNNSSLLADEAVILDYTYSKTGQRYSDVSNWSLEDGHALACSEKSLPASPTATASSTPPKSNSMTGTAHILLVDDNPIVLRTLARIFESSNKKPLASSPTVRLSPLLNSYYSDLTLSLNITISTASNGYEALFKLISSSTTSSPVDLVFIDLEMPFLDGIGTMREIRRLANPNSEYANAGDGGRNGLIGISVEQRTAAESLRGVKVVGLTGNDREERYREAREAGMVECIGKPIRGRQLLEVVSRLVGSEKARTSEPSAAGLARLK